MHALRRRSLAEYDIDRIVLHRGIEYFLDLTRQTVYFVDEQHILVGKIRKNRHKIALLFDGRAAGDADVHPQLMGYDIRQRGLSESGRAV